MTDIVERLRKMDSIPGCSNPFARYAADEITRLRAEVEALRADVAKLREALRRTAFTDTEGTRFCGVCGWVWEASQPELHASGCLAAPKEGER